MQAKKLLLLAASAYAMTLATLGVTTDAQAGYRRLSASGICHEIYSSDSPYIMHSNILRSSAAANSVTWVNCAVPSDNTLAHPSVVTLNVHGYQPAGSSIYTQACSKAYNSQAITCGAISYWGAGNGGVHVSDLSAWTDITAFPYILTNLRNGDLYGYYIST